MATDIPDSNHNWPSFAISFLGLFPYIPHEEAPIASAWRVGDDYETLDSDYRRVEALFLEPIEQTIRTLCRTGKAAHESKDVQYFLGLRSAVLESFLLSFSIPHNDTRRTIIPFPQIPALQIAEWFLIDWWKCFGGRQICQMRLMDDYYELRGT